MNEESAALGLLTFGRSFASAADRLRELDRHDTSAPVYYLYGHGIELMLKAFLRAKGATPPQLKNIGHNLQAALEAADAQALADHVEIASDERTAILMLNAFYSAKQLEYFITSGVGQFPAPQYLASSANALASGLRQVCCDHTVSSP